MRWLDALTIITKTRNASPGDLHLNFNYLRLLSFPQYGGDA